VLSPETPPTASSSFTYTPWPGYSYNISPSLPTPGYVPAGPELLRYHPLAEGIKWLPGDLQAQPRDFYSYVNSNDRLVFARRAGFWKRFLAAGIDLLVIFLPVLFLSFFDYATRNNGNSGVLSISSRDTPNPDKTNPLAFLFLAIILAYFFLTGIKNGQSVGKKAHHLRVIRLDGRKPDWLTAAVRYLAGYMLSGNLILFSLLVLVASGLGGNNIISGLIGLLAFGWGFWWVGWDELKQGWHDKLARTLVVDTREYVEGVHFFKEPSG
jgi:uncharacterized RDD family membrane protein YckC